MNKKVIHTVLENVVAAHGDAIAVATGEAQITYAQLNNNANRFAQLLALAGADKGDIVAVFSDQALLQLYALTGIFKHGGIYLPLDEKYRQNHWNEIYEHIRPAVLIVTPGCRRQLETYANLFDFNIPVIIVADATGNPEHFTLLRYQADQYVEELIAMPGVYDNPECRVDGDDASYIFFTSGSSGRPKAVLGNHKSLSHFVHWESRELELHAGDRVAQLTSLSFDASLRDIFTPLICGGTICIPSKAIKEHPGRLLQWIEEEEITLIHTIPTLMRLLYGEAGQQDAGTVVPRFPKLRYLLLAGEKLYRSDIRRWRSAFGDNTTIINLYGATESTLVKTFAIIGEDTEDDPGTALHVGQPIANTVVLILNAQQQICEIGEVGEVYIKTPFLSMGYYKAEALTAEKFVQNPLNTEKDIIYKTGDYGRYDAQRNIVILGRQDSIVKYNGVRIDLNYVETVIRGLAAVENAICFLEENVEGQKVFACCYSAEEDLQEAIRAHCADLLSFYETPAVLIWLEHFPVNTNGKTDLQVLKQQVTQYRSAGKSNSEPASDTERDLLVLWKDILGRQDIGTGDHFLYLGGDSIRMIRLRSAIHKHFNKEVAIDELFRTAVLKDQALLIDQVAGGGYNHIPKVFRADGYLLSRAQERLWILSQFPEVSLAYHMPGELFLVGTVCAEHLEAALEAAIRRHESLRTVFRYNDEGALRQWVLEPDATGFVLQEIDYRTASDPEAATRAYISRDEALPFDLGQGPLLRAALIRVSDTYSCFYYNMHHIISDGVSNEIPKQEVMAYYDALQKGLAADLPELAIQYKDYAAWQHDILSAPHFQQHGNYWTHKLKQVGMPLQLVIQKKRPEVNSYKGHRLGAFIQPEDFRMLKEFCTQQEGTLFMGILSVWAVLLYKYSGKQEWAIGTPDAGRGHDDLKGQIGCFINSLPLKINIDTTGNLYDLFHQVKQELLDSYAHAAYPFDRMVEDLELPVSRNRNPVFDIMLSYHNIFTRKDDGVTVSAAVEDLGPVVAKLDLLVNFIEEQNYIYYTLDFNTDLFSFEMMKTLTEHFRVVLQALLATPGGRVGDAAQRIDLTQKLRQNNILKLKNTIK